MELYKWQEEILNHEGDQVIIGGRRVGKTMIVAELIGNRAAKYPKTISLITAGGERQETYLFEKVHSYLKEKNLLSSKRQTLTKLSLRNGSLILKYPVGKTGFFVKGLEMDFWYPDEAAYINDMVYESLLPALAVATGKGLGWQTLLSTTFGKRGYFWECSKDPDFKVTIVNAEECPHIPKKFLAKQKERMSDRRYRQEWCGEFIDDAGQYFPTDLLIKQMNFKFWDKTIVSDRSFYLGIDFGGMGEDEEAYAIGELIGKVVWNIHNETLAQSRMRDTLKMTDKFDAKFNFKRMFTDPGGMGVGYQDIFEERYGKRRVIGLNRASKSREKFMKILKEDLYSNCLRLMEEGNLNLIMDKRMMQSLQSIMVIDEKIEGRDDHLADALVNMCWCVKAKGLNLFAM